MRVLELFSGTQSVSKAFHSINKNIEIISLDIEKKFNPTHLCDIMNFDYKQYPKNHFDIIWSSFPCNYFSRMRRTNIGKFIKGGNGKRYTRELLEEEEKTKGLPPLLKSKEIIEYFKPEFYFLENPDGSKADNYIKVHGSDPFLYGINKYVVSYCKYGFNYRKNTIIWTNAVGFNAKLCKNDCDHIENKKHIMTIARLGGQTSFKNKCLKYRIPPLLLCDLFHHIGVKGANI